VYFRDVAGHTAVKASLTKIADSDKIPQTYLFVGPRGVGQLPLAIAFARYILCTGRKDQDSCGECIHCKRVQGLADPDLHFTFPTIGAEAISDQYITQWREMLKEQPYFHLHNWVEKIGSENKLPNITKRECDQILHKMTLKRFEGNRKILILWMPEFLVKEGNRLLKLLEEPTEDSLFILVAENTESILPTILSRCQILRLQPLSADEVIGKLVQDTDIRQEEAMHIAFLAEGSYTDAIQIAQKAETAEPGLFLEWLDVCQTPKMKAWPAWIEKFADLGREKQKNLLLYGLQFIRELMIQYTGINREIKLSQKEIEAILNIKSNININQLNKLVTLFDESIMHVERNGSSKLICFDMSVQIRNILSKSALRKI